MNFFYYDIAVGLPLRQCFTYKSKDVIKKGKRVIVPFGSKSILGIVVKRIVKPKSLKGLKEIISIADEHSCFNGSIFETIKWASDYYHHPIGEVFFSFMIRPYTVLRTIYCNNPGLFVRMVSPEKEIKKKS